MCPSYLIPLHPSRPESITLLEIATSAAPQSDQWVEEFVDVTEDDVSAFEQQQDFWTKLENQWREMAETNEHPWLEDYDEVNDTLLIPTFYFRKTEISFQKNPAYNLHNIKWDDPSPMGI